jgi:hypothetical protein
VKADKLRFYNDKEDHIERPLMPKKPCRRLKTKTDDEYAKRLKEWEAFKPHDRKAKV